MQRGPNPFIDFSVWPVLGLERLPSRRIRRRSIQSSIYRLSVERSQEFIGIEWDESSSPILLFGKFGMLGILNLYKPHGLTSRDCVNQLQRLLRGFKAGHAGTLDPIAEGVLLVAVDKGTRLIEYFQQLSKTYVGEFRLGCRSESLDIESPVEVLENAPQITDDSLQAVLPRFTGKITQVPPKFSAIKVNGKRAYQLAEMESRSRYLSGK